MQKITFLNHFPYTTDPDTTEVHCLSGYGTPGQRVTLSFSMQSIEDIQEIELTTSPLVNSLATIDAEQIDIYVVKTWDSSGVGICQSKRMNVKEFLLKDDRIFFEDGYIEHPKNGIGSESPAWLYHAPNIRLKGSANTSLSAQCPKQIWLSLKIPANIPAATYTGNISVVVNNSSTYKLPIAMEVLSFTVVEPEQDLLLWYRGSMDPNQSQFYVSPDLFQLQLQDIYDHGFRSISICEKDLNTAQLAIDIAEQIGFDRHIVFREIPSNAEALRFKKLKPIFYLSENVDREQYPLLSDTGDSIREHQGNGAYCEILNWSSMSSLTNLLFFHRMCNENDIGYKPSFLCLSLADNKEVFAATGTLSLLDACDKYYYWQSHMEKPTLHRVLAGTYLWKSKAKGIAPYCYQHLPSFPFSPYNDFDPWEPFQRKENFRDRMTTYPAQSGIIPTIQWEGLSEGITDLRYLATLEQLLIRADEINSDSLNSSVSVIKQNLYSFIDRINMESIDINNEDTTEPYTDISAIEYENFRRQIGLAIIELNEKLKQNSANYSISAPILKQSPSSPIQKMSSAPTIFIQIASYRDPECQWTVLDLFSKADRPDLITVGICWQYDPDKDKDCFIVPSPRPNQTKTISFLPFESQGVCWARAQAQTLFEGQDYVLMIDSHMRFIKGWDTAIISELAKCESENSILSNYPPGYKPPNKLEPSPPFVILQALPFNDTGDIRFESAKFSYTPPNPLRGAFLAAGYLFAPGRFIKDLPYDPYLYFDHEEITLATRAYTKGWDVYSPTKTFIYHCYLDLAKGETRALHWADQKDWYKFLGRSRDRYNYLLAGTIPENPNHLADIDLYGLGTERTLKEYEEFCGLDFKNKIASPRALKALFIEELDHYR